MGEKVKEFAVDLQEIARRKLRMLNNSQNITDLQIPPSNRLKKLKGDLKEYYSIRINDWWRIIFKMDKRKRIRCRNNRLPLRKLK